MNRRQSERFDSTVEVGELKPYEESMEGSESSKHWTAIGKRVGGFELYQPVNETVADSIVNILCFQGCDGVNFNAVTMF
jgi:Mor family transcriptional regulator